MSSRLPDTDLANLAFQSPYAKRQSLIAFEGPKIIKGSYEPFRKVFPDTINQQFPLFVDRLHSVNMAVIEERLRLECKGNEKLIQMNRAILQATFLHAQNFGISATGIDVVPIRFPDAATHSIGLNLLIRYPNHAAIVALDMRRSGNLSRTGLAFTFSAMHGRFREAYPDFDQAKLEVWKYRNNLKRDLVVIDEPTELLPFDVLVADVAETYSIWQSVRREEEPKRRAAGGGAMPLFD